MTRIPDMARGAAFASLLLASCSGGAPPAVDRQAAQQPPGESVAAILAHADGAYRDGDLDEAQSAYEEAIRADPDQAHAVPSLATCYLKNRLTRRAEELLTPYLGRHPADSAARLALARVYIRESDLVRAGEALRTVLESDPDNLMAQYNLGFVSYKSRNYGEAEAHLKRTIDLRPDHPEAHYELGLTYLALDRTGEAIAELDRAVSVNPKHVGAHFNLANAYTRAGRGKEAAKERAIYADLSGHSKAQTEHETQIKAQSIKAIQYLLAKSYPEALREYQALAARFPDYAPFYNQIGLLHLRLGRRAEALESLKKAVALDPHLSDPHYVLSNLYREMGDEKGADRELSIFATLETIPEGKSGY